MKRLLRYRILVIAAIFLLLGLGVSLLAKAEELRLAYLLLAPLLALMVSALLLFVLPWFWASLRRVALLGWLLAVVSVLSLLFHTNGSR